MVKYASSTLRTLERLVPGTGLRQGLERIIQQGKGAIIVLGSGKDIDAISSGGFALHRAAFTPAKLAELSKMDGGIVIDDNHDMIVAANVHFVPSNEIPTDETGSRHRTAQRIAAQTGRPVVAVSEGRRIATLYLEGQKVELRSPTEIAARVNQELLTLDRLRRRLDEAEIALTQLELTGLANNRHVVRVLQRAELVRRVGLSIEREAVTLGDEGRLAFIQLSDMVRGIEHLREVTLRDYLRPRTLKALNSAVQKLEAVEESDLEDPLNVARVLGFMDLEDPVTPRGYRVIGQVGRLPDPVRDEMIKHFSSFEKMLSATSSDLENVEG
ncbi:MAG: DNA integrity scanning diadenylate cyclase DisA, partial [Acidimicrobiia bacterium]|nr:DNA integrity scanning diadenylate cyclase DisA [Acidimicrobiia bacterium]